jgi:hypothetical protein
MWIEATMMLRALPSLLLYSCVEYEVYKQPLGNRGGEDSGLPDSDMPEDSAVEEACPEEGLPDEVVFDETCAYTPASGALSVVVEWSHENLGNYGEYNEILGAPVVGQLTDDDGDGDIDRDDIPDIVFVSDDHGEHTHRKGILRVMPGDGTSTGAAISRADTSAWQVYPYRYSNTALGDIDLDGQPEIVIISQVVAVATGDEGGAEDGGGGGVDTAPPGGEGSGGEEGGGTDGGEEIDNPVLPEAGTDAALKCMLSAWSPSGELEWLADSVELSCAGHAPSLADLNGDGAVEVVVGPYIFDGPSGALLAQGMAGQGYFPSNAETGMHSAVADLDLDGQAEVVAGPTVYDSSGAERCTAEGVDDGFVAIADFDMDGLGEWVITANGQVTLLDTDCLLLATWALSGGGNGGPPTVSDFDVDGQPEIGIADAGTYSVYEPSGDLLWGQPITDASSHTTGSSVYDFDGDGRPEVVYADETRLWIFDGATGDVRLEDAGHASRTLHEYPTIADIDGDSSSEIIVPNGGGHNDEELTGLYALGPAEGVWLMSRQVWNQHAYSITNVNDDLSIPSSAASNWPDHNNFRSGDVNPSSAGLSPDAVPLAEVCTEQCDAGKLVLRIRIGNAGAGGLRFGLPVAIYSEVDGGWTLLRTLWSPAVVRPGATSETIELELDPAEVPQGIVVVVVDDDEGMGYVPECHEDNNTIRLEGATCP